VAVKDKELGLAPRHDVCLRVESNGCNARAPKYRVRLFLFI